MGTNWFLLLSNTPYKILFYSLRRGQGIGLLISFEGEIREKDKQDSGSYFLTLLYCLPVVRSLDER